MSRNLLILGAGSEFIEGYLRAKKLNCKIIAVDKDPKAPSLKYADKYINASIHNYLEILKKIKQVKCKIDGVLAFGDVSFVAAKLSSYLKTNSIPIKAAKVTSNKFLFKKEIGKFFNIPKFRKIKNLRQIKSLVNKGKKKYILKPVDNSGARGVIFVDRDSNLDWAFQYSMKYSRSNNYLIAEEFIEGPQLSTEGIVYNGEYIHLSSFDRNYEFINKYKPFIIENGGATPSLVAKKNYKNIYNILSKVVKKLNLKNGTLKGDLIINKNKIYLIEVATRLSGGWLSSVTIPNSVGVNIIDFAIKNSLRMKIKKEDLLPKFEKKIVQRYLFPKIGLIKSVRLQKKFIIKKNGIMAFKIFVKKKLLIEKIDSHASRIGHVIIKSDKFKNAVFLANKILKNICVKYE
jgi:biotin carboxylase